METSKIEVKTNDDKNKNELSDEDKLLQEELNLCVEKLQESDEKLYLPALHALGNNIRASTTSMTSVPKPLKFMKPHYETMKQAYEKVTNPEIKNVFADIISVLAMTMGEGRECLKYRLLSNLGNIGEWGHEYVRHLAGEIAGEWAETDFMVNTEIRDKLILLAKQILPYNMAHNAEAEACDLLMEIERLDLLEQYVDENNYQRCCLYLTSCIPYVADPENNTLLQTALLLFRKFKQYSQALRLAMQLNDHSLIEEIFTTCPDT
nr:26S proteasome non-ATPase regulatory subunit 2-like [Leptinotarsa decemlineata]